MRSEKDSGLGREADSGLRSKEAAASTYGREKATLSVQMPARPSSASARNWDLVPPACETGWISFAVLYTTEMKKTVFQFQFMVCGAKVPYPKKT